MNFSNIIIYAKLNHKLILNITRIRKKRVLIVLAKEILLFDNKRDGENMAKGISDKN
jgi:hypothetical protein